MISIPMSPAEFAEVSRVNLRRLDLWLWAERIRSDPVQGPCRDDTFDPVDGLRKTYWTDPHLMQHVKGSDSTDQCVKCGRYSGK